MLRGGIESVSVLHWISIDLKIEEGQISASADAGAMESRWEWNLVRRVVLLRLRRRGSYEQGSRDSAKLNWRPLLSSPEHVQCT